jgi:hypothetical protein
MKVAFCLYGQPRFLKNPHAIASQRKWVFDEYDTDVFCHYWFDPKDRIYEISNFQGVGGCSAQYRYKNFVLEDTKEIIQERYSPKAFICEKPKVFPTPDPLPDFCKNAPAASELNISNLLSQLYSWEKVFGLLAKNNPEQYDFVIVTRYDLIFIEFPKYSPSEENLVHAHPTYDFMTLNLKDPDIVGKIKPYTNFNDLAGEIHEFDAARFKKLALLKNNITCLDNAGWNIGLVRSVTDDTPGGESNGIEKFRFIAHRGNYKGAVPELENTIEHIEQALAQGYEVEIDIWCKDGKFFSGHDRPDNPIDLDYLLKGDSRFWIHCKNLEAVHELWPHKDTLNMFWHETDTITLTTQNYVWTYPGNPLIANSISVMPELGHKSMEHCVGICSDNLEVYK